jgi:hypothetical protein
MPGAAEDSIQVLQVFLPGFRIICDDKKDNRSARGRHKNRNGGAFATDGAKKKNAPRMVPGRESTKTTLARLLLSFTTHSRCSAADRELGKKVMSCRYHLCWKI